MDETHNAHKLLSHIIFSKFSQELRSAFAWELKTDYPTFKEILSCYCKVITSLVNNKRKPKPADKTSHSGSKKPSASSRSNKSEPNYNTQISKHPEQPPSKHCRFCTSDAHNSVDCTNFVTYKARMEKVKEFDLCPQCTSPRHKVDRCPGTLSELYRYCRYCNSKVHVAALCPKAKNPLPVHACLSTHVGQKSKYLLPVLSIMFQGKGGGVTFNALVDTGSSRSYIHPGVANLLAINTADLNSVEYEVRTFLGSGTKKMGETCLTAYLPSGRYLALPIFVDPMFKLDLEVLGLKQLTRNLKALNYSLGADYPTDSDKIQISGLLGMDLIQFMQFSTVPCMHGQALLVADKLIPFGNSEHFLYNGQVGGYSQRPCIENNYSIILSSIKCSNHRVNTCLEPKSG